MSPAAQALIAALDTRDVPTIRTLLAAYADSVQGVQLQSSAFELLTQRGTAESSAALAPSPWPPLAAAGRR